MKDNVFIYLITEGIKNVFKNKKMSVASLAIMCMTMFIFGIFFIIGENIDHVMTNIKDQQGIQVFLNDISGEEMDAIGEEIKKIEGVNTVEFKSKQDALDTMKEQFGDKAHLLDPFEQANPFSASYIVTLTDLSLMKQVQDKINMLDSIKKITSSEKTVTTLINLANGIRLVTGGILILLIVISIFIISNTIKIAVHSRRKEISIMKYVGATNNFIRWPFIIEGIIIGILAGLVSVLIVGGTYNVITEKFILSEIAKTLNIALVSFSEMFNILIIIYMTLGVGIGIIGSIISMRKYLKV